MTLRVCDASKDTRWVTQLVWISVCIVVAGGCVHLAAGQTWHEKQGWKPTEFFTDSTVIALCDAIAANDLNKMRELIAAGVDVNAKGKGNMTPLLWAFVDDKPERFRLLLEVGADPNVYTESDFGNPRAFQPGDSVTHMASRSSFGHFWPVFDHGGDPNLPSKLRGFAGMTPVYFVIKSGASDKNDRITRLAKLGGNLNRPEGVSSSPLVTAEGHFGRYDLCLLLLDLGADPTKYEGDGVSRITHLLCGTLEGKDKNIGQLRDASPEKLKAFDELVKRLEGMGLSMAEAQADRERWGKAADLIELGEMRRRERADRERREKEAAE